MDVDRRHLVGRGLHNVTVVVGLDEAMPLSRRPTRRRHRRRLDGLAAAAEAVKQQGKATIITATNVFAHMENVHHIVASISDMLDAEGDGIRLLS